MNGEIVRLPEVGKTYAFFDDGKSGFSRRYKAKVVAIFTRKEIEQNEANLYAAWLEQKENCDWIYADMTDYFIKCDIPSYDKNPVWFVRTHEGGWFSIDYPNWWMCGRLDVDGSKCEQIGLPPVDEWEAGKHYWGDK